MNDFMIKKDELGNEEVIVLSRIAIGKVEKEKIVNGKIIEPNKNYLVSIKDAIVKNILGLLIKNDIRNSKPKLIDLLDKYASVSFIMDNGVEHLPVFRDISGKIHGFKVNHEEEMPIEVSIAKKYLDCFEKSNNEAFFEKRKSSGPLVAFKQLLSKEEIENCFCQMILSFGYRIETLDVCKKILNKYNIQ